MVVMGTVIRRRSLGYGLHFCPICRELRQCGVKAVMKVTHIYFLPIGSGEHVVNELTCPDCGSTYGQAPNRTLTTQKERALDEVTMLGSLLSDESSPLLARLELEERLHKLSTAERRTLLAEPFLALSYEYSGAGKKGWRQSVMALGQLILISSLFASPILWFFWREDRNNIPLLISALGVSLFTAAFAALMLWIQFSSPRRITSRLFMARLARSLRPLSPTQQDIEGILKALRARGVEVADSVEMAALMAGLETPTLQGLAA
jgi:hypothetical protein